MGKLEFAERPLKDKKTGVLCRSCAKKTQKHNFSDIFRASTHSYPRTLIQPADVGGSPPIDKPAFCSIKEGLFVRVGGCFK